MRRYGLYLTRCIVGCTCLLPLLLSAAPECGDSDPDALVLLERLSRAGMAVSHRGMATLQRGGDMRVLQIHRDVEGGTVTDTLTLLTGQSAQVVRAGHPEDCRHPGHALLRLRQGKSDACGVAAHYRLSLESGDRVAGRPTRRIIAEPRDMYRYAHVLEVDAETAQLLKVTTLTADGRPLEQFQYASLVLGSHAAAEGEAGDSPGGEVANVAAASGSVGGSPQAAAGSASTVAVQWEPAWVPDGFVATQGDITAAGQTYTDGMASFSVFLEPVDTAMQPGEGAVREGSTLAYTRGMHLVNSTVLITVVGEVPVNTARIVADSVRMR